MSDGRGDDTLHAGTGATERLAARLVDAGTPAADVEAAHAAGDLGMLAFDRLLLSGAPHLTRRRVAEAAGVSIELATRLWRALGFTDVADDLVVFTDDDLEVLRTVAGYLDYGILDEEVLVQLTRVVGSSMARVAEAQMGVLQERMAVADLRGDEAVELALNVVDIFRPNWDRLFAYTHERHLQAAAKRAAFVDEDGARAPAALAVGFADLVGFTALSQLLPEHELAGLVDQFESIAYDTIGAAGGRVVKIVGDEVMFVAERPEAAARIGLALSDVYAAEDLLPDVRVGLAFGPVVGHGGDYFGPVVNLASRLVNIAYPGTVVVSDDLHQELVDEPGFGWKPIRPRRLKGLGLMALWALTPPGAGSQIATEISKRMRTTRPRPRPRRGSPSS